MAATRFRLSVQGEAFLISPEFAAGGADNIGGGQHCGRLQGGFARIRCPKCHAEHLLAFSCRTRNFCSICQAKRSVLFAEKLTSEILSPVPHRHWTFSIPRALRGVFERDRELLGLLSRTAYAAILESFQSVFEPAYIDAEVPRMYPPQAEKNEVSSVRAVAACHLSGLPGQNRGIVRNLQRPGAGRKGRSWEPWNSADGAWPLQRTTRGLIGHAAVAEQNLRRWQETLAHFEQAKLSLTI